MQIPHCKTSLAIECSPSLYEARPPCLQDATRTFSIDPASSRQGWLEFLFGRRGRSLEIVAGER